MASGKVWSKTEVEEIDFHGEPVIQKYATMDEVVTVTAGIKRFVHYHGGKSVLYSNNAIKNAHNHH